MANIIDGKKMASDIREKLKIEVETFVQSALRSPKLSVVLVGDDPGSQVYVHNKERACAEVGIETDTHRLLASIQQKTLIDLLQTLNKDPLIDGILLQLPLPRHLDVPACIDAISHDKDVDGLHPFNLGKLLKGENPLFIPCTPQGIMELILSTGVDIRGKEAVIVGRSNIVGKPVALLLLQRHATVSLCHSQTQSLGEVVRRGDIVIAAAGQPGLIRGEMIKEGAVVIDVGMNRLPGRLTGDVDFESAKEKASYITPVPGGVGPMTIAMLLKNTLKAARL